MNCAGAPGGPAGGFPINFQNFPKFGASSNQQVSNVTLFQQLIKKWDDKRTEDHNWDPTATLTEMSEIIEKVYIKNMIYFAQFLMKQS